MLYVIGCQGIARHADFRKRMEESGQATKIGPKSPENERKIKKVENFGRRCKKL